MSTAPKRIGVLTGGGDCPGLNAVIRAVTKDCLFHGIEVIGIEDGFLGLIENRMRPLDYESVSGILMVGGTVLGSSNKANPLRFATGKNADGSPVFEDMTDQCMTHIQGAGLEALVVIGGDGTMTCAEPFHKRGIGCIGVPKTIDNDIFGTDLSFGFQTAVQVASDAIDRVHTTAQSHGRALVVEVMGRNAGWIALYAGVASGSDIILMPEIPFRIEAVVEHIQWRLSRGRRSTILCVAEGASAAGGSQVVKALDPTSPDPVRLGGIGTRVAASIEELSGVESRAVVLGHVQRGGTPVAGDRILATRFGHHAAELLRQGTFGRMVAMNNGEVTDVDLSLPFGRQRLVPLDHDVVEAARSVFTSFGQ